MVTAVFENIPEHAILDTVKENYDSDYAFSVRLVKGTFLGAWKKWQVMNQFGGCVALYNPESEILTMLV